MFETNWTERHWSSHYPNAHDTSRRQTWWFKRTPHTRSNDCCSSVILPIRSTPRTNPACSFRLPLTFHSRRITKNDLMPHAQSMFDSLFRILTSEKSYENEYVMRAVMRLSSSLHEGVLPYLNQLMDKLVLILRRSSRVRRPPLRISVTLPTRRWITCQVIEWVGKMPRDVGVLLMTAASFALRGRVAGVRGVMKVFSLVLESKQAEFQSLPVRDHYGPHSHECRTKPRCARSIRAAALSGVHADLRR